MMKIGPLIILFYLLSVLHVLAQRVLIPSDSSIRITMDSTGYVESHPHDIPDETGLFIYAADGREALRIYGSFRLLFAWDDKKNFHAYDLTQPTIPTGDDDFHFSNSIGTINMSRLGFDALISSRNLNDMLIRIELDWKGDNEKFRIRHLFLRTEHWLVGKSWSSFNNVAYQIQGVDGRFNGGAVGTRPIQIRYYNNINKWRYQLSIEYSNPSLIQPDTLQAESTIISPDLAANISYKTGSFDIIFASVFRMNRVQFTSIEKNTQSQPGYGGLVATRLHLNENNRITMGASGGVGMGGYMGDFAFVNIDMVYNPGTRKFENMNVNTASLGFEHDWSKEFTSAIGGSILNSEIKSFLDDEHFISGSKILTNLFYRPTSKTGHLMMGAEIEYAERKNMTATSNNTTRASFLLIYNF